MSGEEIGSQQLNPLIPFKAARKNRIKLKITFNSR
jgi:hypothetical protein